MKKLKFISIILLLFIFAGNSVNAQAYDIDKAINETAEYIIKTADNPTVSSVGGDWAVFSLARSGYDIPNEYKQRYLNNVSAAITEKQGILHERKYTEYSRVILALTAIGENPANISGYNLLSPLNDYDKTVWQGLNGAVFALLAADSHNYDNVCRNKYVEYIVSSQNPDGGFSLSSAQDSSDLDITAMALQALAKYKDNDKVRECTERAFAFLSSKQNENGGFGDISNETCENTAQVIVALCENGISADNADFVKNGKTVIDNLMSYYISGGGFAHSHSDMRINQIATEQGLYALSAIKRLSGGNTLYDMTDIKINTPSETEIENTALSEKRFDDVTDPKYKTAVESLASKGIINGKSENMFEPQSTMTRAEFAAVTMRALGITSATDKSHFSDVSQADWFFGCVNAAYENGIIKGISDTEFNPTGTITRAEALVMLARTAAAFGADISSDENSIRNTLAQFGDYMSIPEWARQPAAFCVKSGIMPSDAADILPSEFVTRGEIALMLYNLLERYQGISKNLV